MVMITEKRTDELPPPGTMQRNRALQAQLLEAARQRDLENTLANIEVPSFEGILKFAIRTAEKPLPDKVKVIATIRENLAAYEKLQATKLTFTQDRAIQDFRKSESEMLAKLEKGEALPSDVWSKEDWKEDYQHKLTTAKHAQRNLREQSAQIIGGVLDWLADRCDELGSRVEQSDKLEFQKMGAPYQTQALALRCQSLALKLRRRFVLGVDLSQAGAILDLLEAK